jgi:hypothetical protein
MELEPLHLGAKEVITNMKWPQMVWVPKETWSPQIGNGAFGGSQDDEKNQAKKPSSQDWTFVAQVPHKLNEVMVARFQFKHHVAPLLWLGCMHALHFS